MSVFSVLVIQLIALIICIAIKVFTKRRLNDIDGVKGLSTNGEIEAARARSENK